MQIGWARGVTFPGMPFGQQMTVPVELTLHATPGIPALHAYPVKELETLRGQKHEVAVAAGKADRVVEGLKGDTFDIEAAYDIADDEPFGLTVRGLEVRYEPKTRMLACGGETTRLTPDDKQIRLRILVDRGSVEVFGNGGAVAVSAAHVAKDGAEALRVVTKGKTVPKSLTVYEMKSVWE